LECGFKKLLAEANAIINTVSIDEAAALVAGKGGVLLDYSKPVRCSRRLRV
jgi:hypothetical protein